MTDINTDGDALAELVSAAMDGDPTAADVVARAWKQPCARVRADWHAYQLIGDVLRSADCANPASRDEALLLRVRRRLADEPVVLAPASVAATVQIRGGSWWTWVSAAVAAGVTAVIGLVALQPSPNVESASSGVVASGTVAPVITVALPSREVLVAAPPALGASGAVMIRNAELDRYLAAHGQFAATSAVPAPGLGVRNVSTVAPTR